eukprot:TRINITY_DN8119_c0_g1_i1.p1 TRINITY_DN8119_c0_g1~~TRINITY_DN8119_c0_g1_i1.p1  ORF type:complete len:278 (+),score=28.71 TRINITY_DN8119_c0_g1_i1:52-834(+)
MAVSSARENCFSCQLAQVIRAYRSGALSRHVMEALVGASYHAVQGAHTNDQTHALAVSGECVLVYGDQLFEHVDSAECSSCNIAGLREALKSSLGFVEVRSILSCQGCENTPASTRKMAFYWAISGRHFSGIENRDEGLIHRCSECDLLADTTAIIRMEGQAPPYLLGACLWQGAGAVSVDTKIFVCNQAYELVRVVRRTTSGADHFVIDECAVEDSSHSRGRSLRVRECDDSRVAEFDWYSVYKKEGVRLVLYAKMHAH